MLLISNEFVLLIRGKPFNDSIAYRYDRFARDYAGKESLGIVEVSEVAEHISKGQGLACRNMENN